MIAEKMKEYMKSSSAIREMFEAGKKLASIHGAENVYDFSLGNPNVDTPVEIKEAISEILNEETSMEIHGYMNNSGYETVRESVAQSINRKEGTSFSAQNILMTVGAAGGLNTIFRTLLNPEDEVIAFAPFFGEYRAYVTNYGGLLVVVPADTETFQLNLREFEKSVTKRTKAVLINSPNNPSGVIYSEERIKQLAAIMEAKQKEFGTQIYLISDEPYRELVYDAKVPYLTKYYKNTIVAYSFSKSLSLPGERIGYLVIPDEVEDAGDVIAGANVATRILGFVNAPSLFQKVVARCIDAEVDVSSYRRNRDTLYKGLTEAGYSCVKPEGTFYLFMKSPDPDDKAFCEAAKKHRILIVPGTAFACPGFVRIAYCVSHDTIRKALPGFAALRKEYQ